MAVEVCLVSPFNGRDIGRAYLPVDYRHGGTLPSTEDLRVTLAGMWREACKLRLVPEFGKLQFTVVQEDGEYHEGTVKYDGVNEISVVRFLP